MGDAQVFDLLSGRQVTLLERLVEQDGALERWRFVAPDLRARLDEEAYSELAADLLALCEQQVAPGLDPNVTKIVVSFSEAPVPFGETEPNIAQAFEAFVLTDGVCTWDQF